MCDWSIPLNSIRERVCKPRFYPLFSDTAESTKYKINIPKWMHFTSHVQRSFLKTVFQYRDLNLLLNWRVTLFWNVAINKESTDLNSRPFLSTCCGHLVNTVGAAMRENSDVISAIYLVLECKVSVGTLSSPLLTCRLYRIWIRWREWWKRLNWISMLYSGISDHELVGCYLNTRLVATM